MSMPQLLGHPRADGSIGVRNHVLVVSAMDVTNSLARRIAAAVPGAVSITTAFGRGHAGAERTRHEHTLAGLIRNPNVAAALIVGFEPDTTDRLAESLSDAGKPVETRTVLSDGSTSDLERDGARLISTMVTEADRERVPLALSSIVLGLKCGGSDPTSGLIANAAVGRVTDWLVAAGGTAILTETEDMLGGYLDARAATPEVAAQFRAAVHQLERQAKAAGTRLSALHEDHLRTGLTTNEEKALGAIQKAGSSPLQEVIGYAERPTRKGLIFMDAIGGGIPEITGLAAAGAHVILFVTGSGHPTGHPIAPTLKITGNPRTAARFATSIDVDVSPALTGDLSLDAAADLIRAALLAICAGQPTRNEHQGDIESTIASVHAWSQHLVRANP